MRSSLVVISWWSNCLGLTCLHKLADHSRQRDIYVVQVGKSESQTALFRRHLPQNVRELWYPAGKPVEHSRVITHVVRNQLPALAGIWFVDHDLFIHENWEPWLTAYDEQLQHLQLWLCLPPQTQSPAVTQPAFWLSPANFPRHISLDQIPFETSKHYRRPDLYQYTGPLKMPVKDTLVHAREILQRQERVGNYTFDRFPEFTHLGGLYLFTGTPLHEPAFQCWQERTIAQFISFFKQCPPEWVAIEEPTLLHRVHTFLNGGQKENFVKQEKTTCN
jgi:hypothetical protein